MCPECVSAAKAKQRTEYRNQKETKNGKSPGESPLFADNLGAVALGAAVYTGSQGFLMGCMHIQMLNRRLGGLLRGFGRQSAAAMLAEAVFGIGGNFHLAV